MLKGNSNSTNSFSMDPKFLPTTYFAIIISRERFWKRDFFTVHKKNLLTQSKAEIKLHNHNPRGILTIYSL